MNDNQSNLLTRRRMTTTTTASGSIKQWSIRILFAAAENEIPPFDWLLFNIVHAA